MNSLRMLFTSKVEVFNIIRFRDKRIVYISPHLDDAALSNGGIIRRLQELCSEFVLINIFTQSTWTADNRENDENIISAIRRQEDLSYCNGLNITSEYLGFKDSSLRGYNDETEITTKIEPIIYSQTKETLLKLIEPVPYDYIFAPLGIGNHIDHIITFQIMKELNYMNTIYYEDLPYAFFLKDEEITQISRQRLSMNYQRVKVDISIVYDQKVKDILIYESQLEEQTLQRIEAYSYRWEHANAVENIWLTL